MILYPSKKMNYQNVVGGRYVIHTHIGGGSFGSVYKGEKISNGDIVAIKFENSGNGMLKHETNILNYLYRQGITSIPNVRWFGSAMNSFESQRIPCLVIPMYDGSLELYLNNANLVSRECTAMNLMSSVIKILSDIHINLVLHRDIKPDNLMMRGNKVMLIDFGLSCVYTDSNGDHKSGENIINPNILGSPKYISYNIHMGSEASRRDDLISLGYIFLEILTGGVPWNNVGIYTSSIEPIKIFNPRNEFIKSMKTMNRLSDYISQHPKYNCLFDYLKSCYFLRYASSPNYIKLTEIIDKGLWESSNITI
jgi:serine/threonine protein kinase